MPLFSTIIPVYNRADLVRKAIDSVLAQTVTDNEIIVVDDGSTDDTPRVLDSYGGRIQVLLQLNRGVASARNLGVRHASGEYVIFLDSDDLWFPWTLEVYRNLLDRPGRPTFVVGRLFYFAEESELAPVSYREPVTSSFPDYFATSRLPVLVGTSCSIIRRDAIVQAGGFFEHNINSEDQDLALRLGVAPGFVRICEPATVAYRQHAQALTRDLSRGIAGIKYMVAMEKAGRYPGGTGRRRERQHIITRHARPICLACLRRPADLGAGWQIYRCTFWWHVLQARWRFLGAVPVLASWHFLRATCRRLLDRVRGGPSRFPDVPAEMAVAEPASLGPQPR